MREVEAGAIMEEGRGVIAEEAAGLASYLLHWGAVLASQWLQGAIMAIS
jgi:hypothetical protein